jgi:hypothetical protein
MEIQTKKSNLIPDYIVETVYMILEESKGSNEPLQQLAERIVSLSYTSGLNAGLNTALLLCEETNNKIHTAIN